MSTFLPHLAAIRFGTGRSAVHADPESPQAMLKHLAKPDDLANTFPVALFDDARPQIEAFRDLQRQRRDGLVSLADERRARNKINDAENVVRRRNVAAIVARGIAAQDGFRERLAMFWSDHFAVATRGVFFRARSDTFTEEAIRPHLTGRFSDMLKAATLHPSMLEYLDQTRSVGPGSEFAKAKGGQRGLNENLAREVMELHTLGARADYTQQDVRQLAELLAGVTLDRHLETIYLPKRSEPGAETILGYSSQAAPGQLAEVHEVLDHLAAHPATAAHLARKLAVHFVSDDPDPGLVSQMEKSFRETDGDLSEVYRALLTHPAAWHPELKKVKRPIEFLISSLRARGADPQSIGGLPAEEANPIQRWILWPLQAMGQDWGNPGGPNGWPEEASAWITPNTLSERMRWTLRSPNLPGVPEVGDPKTLMNIALGPLADAKLAFAAGAAETRAEGELLVLMSPPFQRR